MGSMMPRGVLITPLQTIPTSGGQVLHAIKDIDSGFSGFGEAYFSSVNNGVTRGWKLHKEMTLNLVVVLGEIKFSLVEKGFTDSEFTIHSVTLSRGNYQRLTVPPGIWVAFTGMATGENLLLNVANLKHDPTETEIRELSAFPLD